MFIGGGFFIWQWHDGCLGLKVHHGGTNGDSVD